jgi:glycosyltransferase involved in cell wall biosynthesis
MISFIIIGKNEEKNLKRCIDSIYKGISVCRIPGYEIIYVDSKSTDKSIEIAGQFAEVKIFRATGECNAAVGRNIGAKESSGDVLFFVDGDMEIYSEFLAGVWDSEKNDINENFVAGEWNDIFGTKQQKRDSSKVFPGGTFLIKRELWESVNGMRTRFKTGEESDLGFRLMKKGYRFHRKPEFIINHYTVPYMHGDRIWKSIWNRNIFYNRAVMYRHHLFNSQMYALMWRLDKTFIILILAIIATIIYPLVGLILFGGYLLAVVMRVARNERYLPFLKMIGFYLVSDFLNLVNFFIFYPKDKKLEYHRVQNKILQD